jgi:hypothetical protein
MKLARHPGSVWWLAAVLLAIGIVVLDSAERLYLVRGITAVGEANAAALPPDRASPSGFAHGQRTLILPGIGLDGYQWIMQTQRMLAGDGLRIRSVTYDNPPQGRPVHWSSSFRWWLAAVAWFDSQLTSHPWAVSVERVAPWANPLLLVLAIGVVAPFVARRFGAVAAALFALGLVTVYPVFEAFAAGGPDHHGLAIGFGLLTMLGLAAGGAGWVRETAANAAQSSPLADTLAGWLPNRSQARRWFIASAIAGGAGLWVSAPTVIPLLGGIGLGALWSTGWLGRGRSAAEPGTPDPTLWRIWGFAGGASSLGFYLLEYAPANFGWRLEVNHPLYALAWMGAGDLLCRVCQWWQTDRTTLSSRSRVGLFLSVAAVVAAPAIMLVAPERTFFVADDFLWALHRDYIAEFRSLARQLAGMNAASIAMGISAVPLVGWPLAGWLWHAPWARPWRALFGLVFAPGVVLLVLAFAQVRWLGIDCAVWLVALVVAGFATTATGTGFQWTVGRWIIAGALLALIGLPYPWYVARTGLAAAAHDLGASEQDMYRVATRDVARWLRTRLGGERGVVLAAPTETTSFIYHGGFDGLGTLYWENGAGLKAAAEIFGAATPERALQLVRQHGITHFVLFSWAPFAESYARLARGLPATQPVPPDAFIAQLQRMGAGPAWLRPVYYALPDHPYLRNQWVRVYEVVPEQSRLESQVRTAQYLLADGKTDEAESVLGVVLESNAGYLPALITLAHVQLAREKPAAFAAVCQRIDRNLAGAGKLELGDRINLAVVFDAIGDSGRARTLVESCLATADEKALRRLAPETLGRLLLLTRQLNAAVASPDLFRFAVTLLPTASLQRAVMEEMPRQ